MANLSPFSGTPPKRSSAAVTDRDILTMAEAFQRDKARGPWKGWNVEGLEAEPNRPRAADRCLRKTGFTFRCRGPSGSHDAPTSKRESIE